MTTLLATLPVALWLSSSAVAQVTYDFEVHPSFQGWYHTGPEGWTTAQAQSPTHSYLVNGIFGTPFISDPDGSYVAVDFSTFAAPASATAEFAFGFQPIKTGPGWSQNTFTFRSRGFATGDRANFWGTGLYLDDVTVRPVTRAAAAAIQDANIAQFMPAPINFAAPTTRQTLLPDTINQLRTSQAVTALMMGDSIVHDSYGSFFEPRVDRQYSGSRLNIREATSGGAGAGYWIQNDRIRTEILANNPGLLMFGGISTSQADIPLLAEVVRQARAVNPAIEIVLMSPLAGDLNNPYQNPSLAQPFDPVTGTDYRANLYRKAQELGVQFWDLTTPWARFILDSGRPYDYYLRDPVHMNGYGNMLAGRILNLYFSPVPEPGSLALAGAGAVAAWLIARRRARRA